MAFDAAGASSLEQFTLLAKNARGRACVALIQQVLSNKKLFVFRELLDMPNIQALQGSEHQGHFDLLRIFCFGTYGDYLARKDELPALTPQQVQKLRKLTVVTLAHRHKNVPYDTLMEALDVSTVRELEDVLIDTIYSGLIQGKLDQKSRHFVVKYAVGRDTHHADIDSMIEKLTSWKVEAGSICEKIDAILAHAEAVAEEERKRDEALRAKMAARANERKTSGSSRMAEDFSLFPDAMGRRGQMPNKRVHAMSRKGRI